MCDGWQWVVTWIQKRCVLFRLLCIRALRTLAEDRSWQWKTKEPFGPKYKMCMTIWTCPCFSFRNSWNFVFFVLACIFNLNNFFSLCLLPLVRERLQEHISSVLWLWHFLHAPVPRSDRQGMGLKSNRAAQQLSVSWGIAHSVLCHGTEEGELILLWLTGLFLEGCSQLETPHYKSAGDQLERVHRRVPQKCLKDQTDEERV